MQTPAPIKCPPLAIDARLASITPGWKPSKTRKQEQAIVANLIRYLDANDWKVVQTHDGDAWVSTRTMLEVLELVFNLDEARACFEKGGKTHSVLLICGNGLDVVSDYSFSASGADDFETLMEEFDPENYR